MPAFGKNGIVNINGNSAKTTWQVVKSDGTVVASFDNQQQAESHKANLSQNADLTIKQVTLQCL